MNSDLSSVIVDECNVSIFFSSFCAFCWSLVECWFAARCWLAAGYWLACGCQLTAGCWLCWGYEIICFNKVVCSYYSINEFSLVSSFCKLHMWVSFIDQIDHILELSRCVTLQQCWIRNIPTQNYIIRWVNPESWRFWMKISSPMISNKIIT